jgi:hypothetical protein
MAYAWWASPSVWSDLICGRDRRGEVEVPALVAGSRHAQRQTRDPRVEEIFVRTCRLGGTTKPIGEDETHERPTF